MHTSADLTTPHTEHLRPTSHFTPERTWMNDPNGLVQVGGVYHLFFQTNPEAATWGNMSWGHATSTDLLSWTEHDVAIRHTEQEAIFSGSVVVDHHNTSGLGREGQVPLVAIYTSHYLPDSDRHGTQAQSLAWSIDAGSKWTVAHELNPVLCRQSSDFRDPKVFWSAEANRWVMVAVEAVEHRVIVYGSDDLRDWTELSSVGPCADSTGPWECPDLMRLRVAGTDETHWVLVVSVGSGGPAGGSGTWYVVGEFDGTTFAPHDGPDGQWRWLDHGPDHYAAVSFNNVPDRTLMVGWGSNWAYANQTPTAPWRSSMSYVREVDLVRADTGSLHLRQLPVLPSQGITRAHAHLPATPGNSAEIRLTTAEGLDPLVIRIDGDRRTVVLDRSECGDTGFHPAFVTEVSAPLATPSTDVDIEVLVDGCIVEVYLEGGLTVLTAQVFPSAPLTNWAVIRTP